MISPRSNLGDLPYDMDTTFDPPRAFIPIDEAAKDGDRQLVRRGADYAAAQWVSDFWSYPIDPTGETGQSWAQEIDFEPTHYAPKDQRPFAGAQAAADADDAERAKKHASTS
ncbi:hypothetical protein [Sphingosinicella sp. BN140058]|uniref:hypothetical protein n=1 Tax=Sphingosinicella sp. BN140058 TaxID=1892855 RepID=UPI0010131FDF|nr:hypothetical protein [Sphingosinicella sp. BN140058]QAY80437.1 hypothetical protein ETR14_27750 [Sphingosinicella sp. BN140058]